MRPSIWHIWLSPFTRVEKTHLFQKDPPIWSLLSVVKSFALQYLWSVTYFHWYTYVRTGCAPIRFLNSKSLGSNQGKATYVPGEHIKKNEGKGLFELKWRNFASQNAREINWVFHEVSSSALLARLWLHTSRLPTTVVVTGAFWIASSFFFHGLKVFFLEIHNL